MADQDLSDLFLDAVVQHLLHNTDAPMKERLTEAVQLGSRIGQEIATAAAQEELGRLRQRVGTLATHIAQVEKDRASVIATARDELQEHRWAMERLTQAYELRLSLGGDHGDHEQEVARFQARLERMEAELRMAKAAAEHPSTKPVPAPVGMVAAAWDSLNAQLRTLVGILRTNHAGSASFIELARQCFDVPFRQGNYLDEKLVKLKDTVNMVWQSDIPECPTCGAGATTCFPTCKLMTMVLRLKRFIDFARAAR